METKEIEKLKRLAKIDLEKETTEEFLKEIEEAVAFLDGIDEGEEGSEGVESMEYASLREDEVVPSFPVEEITLKKGGFSVKRGNV